MAYLGSGSIKMDGNSIDIGGGGLGTNLYLSGAHSFTSQKIHCSVTEEVTEATIVSSYVEVFAGRAFGDGTPLTHTLAITSPRFPGEVVHFRCMEAPSGSGGTTTALLIVSGNTMVDGHGAAFVNAALGTGHQALAACFTLVGTTGGKWAILDLNDDAVAILP